MVLCCSVWGDAELNASQPMVCSGPRLLFGFQMWKPSWCSSVWNNFPVVDSHRGHFQLKVNCSHDGGDFLKVRIFTHKEESMQKKQTLKRKGMFFYYVHIVQKIQRRIAGAETAGPVAYFMVSSKTISLTRVKR